MQYKLKLISLPAENDSGMNISELIKRYYNDAQTEVNIDMFDAQSIYAVYQRIVSILTRCVDIEISVLQAMSYCFYEILDNVLTHSDKKSGTVITHYNPRAHTLSLLIADDGKGVQLSLSENPKYADISEEEALMVCINDSVSDGKGMGFGLYSTSILAYNAGVQFEIHSGSHKLQLVNGRIEVADADFWHGTIVYLQLQTNNEINPKEIVVYRTNIEEQYNDTFLNDNNINELW